MSHPLEQNKVINRIESKDGDQHASKTSDLKDNTITIEALSYKKSLNFIRTHHHHHFSSFFNSMQRIAIFTIFKTYIKCSGQIICMVSCDNPQIPATGGLIMLNNLLPTDLI